MTVGGLRHLKQCCERLPLYLSQRPLRMPLSALRALCQPPQVPALTTPRPISLSLAPAGALGLFGAAGVPLRRAAVAGVWGACIAAMERPGAAAVLIQQACVGRGGVPLRGFMRA